MSDTLLRSLRLTLASLLAVALVAQLAIGMSRGGLTIVNFFSYFTVLSNTAAVVMLTKLATRPRRDSSQGFAVFRGAVTVYMSATGLVYALILVPSAADLGLTEPWVDWTLHVIGPTAIAADWIVNRPRAGLSRITPAIWTAFPAAYLSYTLVRGPIADWYPYPILDPDETGGYRGVAVWWLVILVIIAGLSYVYLWWAGRSATDPVAA
jgi:hypothetical protein